MTNETLMKTKATWIKYSQ